MPATDLTLLIEAAQAAGEIATSYSGKEAKLWYKPENAGPVTEADMAVNDLLEQKLQSARPDYGWLSEESEDNPDRLSRDRVFIVDPIDGTRSFSEGSDTWAHALAVVEKGIVTAGVVYLPKRGLMYSAARGQGAFLNDTPITPSDSSDLDAAQVLATRPNMDPKNWRGGHVPGFHRSHRPSLAYRMALVAQGRFDAMLTLRACWEWDIAAGDLILREAGAMCTDKSGHALKFNNPHPQLNGVIAGGVAMHDRIRTSLRAA
ncbi:3'(2'),5'-bisphosphate nucleotidase CysQ [Arenibacterium sp. CAU 1754]